MKLVTPIEVLMEQMTLPIPGWFVQFIGVCEVLGALGLVLPSILRLRPGLTPLASYGLVLIMVGATLLTAASGPAIAALFPFVVGLLATGVAYGRWQLVPISAAAPRFGRQTAGIPHRAGAVAR
jgi:hypothetical protein